LLFILRLREEKTLPICWSAGLEFMPLWAVEMRRRINAIRYTINDLIWMKKEC